MKILFLISLALTVCLSSIKGQPSHTTLGVEIGHQHIFLLSQGYSSVPYHTRAGVKAGFFLEQEIKPSLGLRFNLFYDLKYFQIIPSDFLPFAYHSIALPIKAIFKTGKIFRFGLGIIPRVLMPFKSSNTQCLFNFGPSVEIALKFKKIIRFSLYCNYDLLTVHYKTYGDFNNLAIGLSCAVTLKKIKKRRVIYSPG